MNHPVDIKNSSDFIKIALFAQKQSESEHSPLFFSSRSSCPETSGSPSQTDFPSECAACNPRHPSWLPSFIPDKTHLLS
jgi:hypothetical protein